MLLQRSIWWVELEGNSGLYKLTADGSLPVCWSSHDNFYAHTYDKLKIHHMELSFWVQKCFL